MPGCIQYSNCTSSQKGMFVEVRYFQFLNFDIHDDVKSRYLRQVTEREQEERAQYELGEKVCGAGAVTYLLTLFFCLCISLMKLGWKKVIINRGKAAWPSGQGAGLEIWKPEFGCRCNH